MTAEPDEVPVWDDAERWREQCLRLAGYPEGEAHALAADQDVDLHVAVELLASGCPLETALKILI